MYRNTEMIAPAMSPLIMPANVPANIQIKKNVAPTSTRMSALTTFLSPNLSSKKMMPIAAIIPVINIIYLLYLVDKARKKVLASSQHSAVQVNAVAKDAHVLAAAITTSAQVIVTENLKDFPSKALAPFDIDAISADEFISDAIELDPLAAVAALRKMRARFKNPEMDAEVLLQRIKARKLFQTAETLHQFLELL